MLLRMMRRTGHLRSALARRRSPVRVWGGPRREATGGGARAAGCLIHIFVFAQGGVRSHSHGPARRRRPGVCEVRSQVRLPDGGAAVRGRAGRHCGLAGRPRHPSRARSGRRSHVHGTGHSLAARVRGRRSTGAAGTAAKASGGSVRCGPGRQAGGTPSALRACLGKPRHAFSRATGS